MQSWLEQITQQCRNEYCRRLVVIDGEQAQSWRALGPWLSQQAQLSRAIGIVGAEDHDYFSKENLDSTVTLLKANRPNNLLGFEHDHVIFDAFSGLYPDALAAVSGTIKAGGLLILLCPALKSWSQYQDVFSLKRQPHSYQGFDNSPNFVQRLINSIQAFDVPISFSTKKEPLTSLSPLTEQEESATPAIALAKGALTSEQEEIVGLIASNLDCPHVITADRGRGKSYLLGSLVAQRFNTSISKDNGITYCLTGPNKKSVESVLTGAGPKALENIQYLPPENVMSVADKLNHNSDTNIGLLVDEAASLPIPLLMEWAKHFKHIVFATTTHGYEGTGKGFQIRFFKHLNQTRSNWMQHQLFQPVRYAKHDPLEKWIFHALMLNAEPSGIEHAIPVAKTYYREVSQQELVKDETLLANIFGLLINAHYQTKPSDLRDMLDAPGLRIFIQTLPPNVNSNPIVLSACLCTDEGPIEPSLWQPICQGYRRPTGHLIPQSFGFYLGQPEAMALKFARVIRIATLPDQQRKHFGSELMQFIESTLKAEQYDVIGSSFAGTQDVIQFWKNNGFEVIKHGSTADHASGVASALVVKPLSKRSEVTIAKAKHFFSLTSSQDTVALHGLPDSAQSILHDFAHERGSVESTLLILKCLKDFSLPNLPLNKNAANRLRLEVRNYLSDANN